MINPRDGINGKRLGICQFTKPTTLTTSLSVGKSVLCEVDWCNRITFLASQGS